MKISMDTKHKILIYSTIIIGILILAYLIYMGIKLNKTSNKMSGIVKKELKDTNVNTLLEGENFKVAKLNRNENNKEVFVKNITKTEINNLEMIVSRGNKILSLTSQYQKNFHYSIILNDTSKANFYIHLNDNYVIINYLNENYVVFRESDISYLIIVLDILGNANISNTNLVKYNQYKDVSLQDYNSPVDMYLNGITKMEKSTYSWSKKENSDISSSVSTLVKTPKEILKNKNSISITKIDTFISINNKDTKLKLPEGTKIKYKFFKENEDEKQIEFLDAYRMIDSSYYLILPEESSEYILYIHAEFDDTHKCDYCIKCKL